MASAFQSAQSQNQIDVLNQAIKVCKEQIKTCQQSCGGAPNPNSNLPKTLPTPSQNLADNLPKVCLKAGDECSPLVVQLPAPEQRLPASLSLTSPDNGVWFDILGLRSLPLPFTKQLISWPLPESRGDNYFLVLPNAQGEVLGINELFGNNTLGPDQQFAENGFLALAKMMG